MMIIWVAAVGPWIGYRTCSALTESGCSWRVDWWPELLNTYREWLQLARGLVVGVIEHLQKVTTCKCNTITNSYLALQYNTFLLMGKTNSVALSPQANYTDWATATCRQNLVPTFVDRWMSRGQSGGSPTIVNLSFLDRRRYFSFK
jgi:hypothetical protein